jgi:hypothetical protein
MRKIRTPRASMRKTVARKPARRSRAAAPKADGAAFSILADTALTRGDPDAISDQTLHAVLAAAVRVYAAKVERRGDLKPFPEDAVTATEAIVAACGIVRAADLNPFDLAMWFHRMPAR